MNIGIINHGTLFKKKRIYWETQLFAITRSFKDGITFFRLNINCDRYEDDHSPAFQIDISGNTFKGNSYDGYEFVTETKCTIHVVDFKDGESMLSVTWFNDKINIRYYVKKLR